MSTPVPESRPEPVIAGLPGVSDLPATLGFAGLFGRGLLAPAAVPTGRRRGGWDGNGNEPVLRADG